MAVSKLALRINQGATFRKRLKWSAGVPPVPVDLTDCTARMHIRGKITDAQALLVLTTENTRITLGGVAGTVDLELTDEVTAAQLWTTGVYDLEIEFPDGFVKRLVGGTVTVSPEVTRA